MTFLKLSMEQLLSDPKNYPPVERKEEIGTCIYRNDSKQQFEAWLISFKDPTKNTCIGTCSYIAMNFKIWERKVWEPIINSLF